MTISGEVVHRPSRRSRNYLQLLAIAHDQLLAEFGEAYSTAELLRAAQMLVEVADAHYVPRDLDRAPQFPNYFTFETAEMIERNPWLIFCKETACHDSEPDELELAALAARKKFFLG
jgi:hypothetical protein